VASDQETVLVVEDEDIARKNLQHILNKMGYQVTAVNNGTKALDWLESIHSDKESGSGNVSRPLYRNGCYIKKSHIATFILFTIKIV